MIIQLKEYSQLQYQKYLKFQRHKDKLIFFCYPEYLKNKHEVEEFPDPAQYLIGFFVCDSIIKKSLCERLASTSAKFSTSQEIKKK